MAAKRTGSNKDGWDSALYYLRDFTGGTIKISNLTPRKCRDFREHMLTALSQRNGEPLAVNSTVNYFNKFKAALKQAYKDGLINTDLDAQVESIKSEETRREHLTLRELQTLAATELGWSRLAGHFTYESLIEKQFDNIGFQSQSVNDSLAMSAAYGRYNTRATVAFNIVKQLITGIF